MRIFYPYTSNLPIPHLSSKIYPIHLSNGTFLFSNVQETGCKMRSRIAQSPLMSYIPPSQKKKSNTQKTSCWEPLHALRYILWVFIFPRKIHRGRTESEIRKGKPGLPTSEPEGAWSPRKFSAPLDLWTWVSVCGDSFGLWGHHSRQVNKLNVFTFAIKKDGRTERITENDRRFKIEQ